MKLNTFITLLAASGFLVAGASAGTISLNFDGQSGTGTPGAVTGVAGAIAVGNWNNTGPGNAGNAGPLDLVDDSGAATGAVAAPTIKRAITVQRRESAFMGKDLHVAPA